MGNIKLWLITCIIIAIIIYVFSFCMFYLPDKKMIYVKCTEFIIFTNLKRFFINSLLLINLFQSKII